MLKTKQTISGLLRSLFEQLTVYSQDRSFRILHFNNAAYVAEADEDNFVFLVEVK